MSRRYARAVWMAALLCAGSGAVALATPSGSSGRPEPASSAPQIDGWTIQGDAQVFDPASLYQHINGASELYLSYDFRSLLVADYASGGSAVTVEIYDHGSPAAAFGIYSQERPAEPQLVDVGAQGYIEPPILNFIAGDLYVKLSALDLVPTVTAELESLGRGLVRTLVGDAPSLGALALFPTQSRVRSSERYAHKDFLGYSSLRSAFTVDYTEGETRFQLFIIEAPSENEAVAMIKAYAQAASGSALLTGDGSLMDVADLYNGPVLLVRGGSRVGGVVGLADALKRQQWGRTLLKRMSSAAPEVPSSPR